ncbi:MAG: hypothetical protein GF311_03605 [Candidatus Lokiarchaeota archaeon]|nr:hypothetical protein [Candidatus Lokiarchaeota archaeon]
MKIFEEILHNYGLSKNQSQEVSKKLNSLDYNNFQTFKDLMNSYPHPSQNDVENYLIDPSNKAIISGIDYGGIDDLICGTINNLKKETPPEEAYSKLIPYLNMVLQYEQQENKHTHKGAIYFNIGQYLIKIGQIEKGLYFIHRGLIEDDMKHIGNMNFPNVWSYQIIILDEKLNHPYVKDMILFLNDEFLKRNYNFNVFFDNFLDKPSKAINNAIIWLNHIAFFHIFLFHLRKLYLLPEDLFKSILGEISSSNLIGDLCLLIESICKLKYPSINVSGRETFSNIYNHVKTQYSWRGAPVNGPDFDLSNLNNTLSDIFSNSYQGSKDPFQNSFYLSWGLRNKVHHKIDSVRIIRENFKSIIEKQMEFFLDLVINKS